MRAHKLLLVFVALSCIPAVFAGEIASDGPITIIANTSYSVTENEVFIELIDNVGKDQSVNLSHNFKNHSLTQEVNYEKVLMNQSYEANITGLVNTSLGKYQTATNYTFSTNNTSYTKTNYTDSSSSLLCESNWKNDTETLETCDYILDDKSVLVEETDVIGTETRYKYQPLPDLKEKTVINGKKIERKQEGIPLPKNGRVQLKLTQTHPNTFGMDTTGLTDVFKYNITASSKEGITILDPWWNSSWGKRKVLTVQSVSGTPTVSKALPIYLSNGSGTTTGTGNVVIDFNDLQANGEDLRFIDPEDNDQLLSYEIEMINATDAVVWVYDTYTRDGSDRIEMYYNNPSASNGEDVAGTWNNAGQHVRMVQHLQDNPLTGTDSSDNNNDGTVNGMTSVSGVFDGAASADGTDDNINFGTVLPDATSGGVMIEAWIKPDVDSVDNNDIYVLGGWVSGVEPYFALRHYNTFNVAIGERDDTSNNFDNVDSGVNITDGNWHYVVGVLDIANTEARIYVDGVLATSVSDADLGNGYSFSSDNTEALIAEDEDGSRDLAGDVDNAILYNTTEDSNAIESTYNASRIGGQTFFSQSAAETENNAPNPSIISPANDTTTSDATPDVEAKFIDFEDSTATLRLWEGTTNHDSNASALNNTNTNLTFTSLSDGLHTYFIEANDGRASNNTTTRHITVDTTPPTTTSTLENGSGGTYTLNQWIGEPVNVTLSCTDTTLSCDVTRYSVNEGSFVSVDTTYSSEFQITNTGRNYLRYKSNDTLGNLESNNDESELRVDLLSPSLSFQNSNVTQNLTKNDALFLNISVSDPDSGVSVVKAGNGTTLDMTNVGGSEYQLNTSVSGIGCPTDQNCTVRFYAMDVVGNWKNATTLSLDIDTVAPSLSYVSPTPADSSIQASDSATINTTVSDDGQNLDVCILEFDGSNETVTPSSGVCEKQKTGLSDGSHTFNMWANDTQGNINAAGERTFTVDTTNPSISLTFPPQNDNLSRGDFINITGTASDSNSDTVVINDSLFGTNQGTYASWNFTNTGSVSDGDYVFLITANDTAGNSASVTSAFTVDTTPPTISYVSPTPANGTTLITTNNITINATVSEATTTATCILEFDGSNETVSVTNKAYCEITKNVTDGATVQYKMWVNDSAGNYNVTEERWITNNKKPSLDTLKFVPSPPNATKDLDANITATDSDNSSLNVWLDWQVNGQSVWNESGTLQNNTETAFTLKNGNFSDGNTVKLDVTVSDSFENATSSISDTVGGVEQITLTLRDELNTQLIRPYDLRFFNTNTKLTVRYFGEKIFNQSSGSPNNEKNVADFDLSTFSDDSYTATAPDSGTTTTWYMQLGMANKDDVERKLKYFLNSSTTDPDCGLDNSLDVSVYNQNKESWDSKATRSIGDNQNETAFLNMTIDNANGSYVNASNIARFRVQWDVTVGNNCAGTEEVKIYELYAPHAPSKGVFQLNSENLSGTQSIRADAIGYSQREYLFTFDANESFTQTLYLLKDGDSTEHTLNAIDNSTGDTVSGATFRLWKDISGSLQIVAEEKTDSTGSITVPLKDGDKYTVHVEKTGYNSVNYTYTPSANDLSVDFEIAPSGQIKYSNPVFANGINASCGYNNATNVLTCNYSNSNEDITRIEFITDRQNDSTDDGWYNICNENHTSNLNSGTFTCNVGSNAENQTHRYILKGYQQEDDGDIVPFVIVSDFLSFAGNVSYGLTGVLLSFLLILTTTMAGLKRPIVGMTLAVVGVLVSWWIGILTLSFAGIASLILVVILVLIRQGDARG